MGDFITIEAARRAVDACGGAYSAEEVESRFAEGHSLALADADKALAKEAGEDLEAQVTEAKSHTAYYAKTLIALRHTLVCVTDDLEDEGDRVYFGSSNDADRLRDISGRIDDLAWEEIMADSQPPVNLYDAIERGNAERKALGEKPLAADEIKSALLDALKELLAVVEGECSWLLDGDRNGFERVDGQVRAAISRAEAPPIAGGGE